MKQKKKNDTSMFKAKALIAVGIFFGVWTFLWYIVRTDVKFFTNQSNIQDLGTILSGTTGLCFTLAGIFYIKKTIEQTRKDMRDTREIMSKQMAEATFFNLVNNHRQVLLLVGGTFEFEKYIAQLKSDLEKYKRAIDEPIFYGFETTRKSPVLIYEERSYLKTVGSSMIHTINYITTDLESKYFFHNTFFLSLSLGERFLLGMIIMNNLEGEYDFDYPYHKYFEEKSAYKNSNSSGDIEPVKLENFANKEMIISSTELNELNVKIIKELTRFDLYTETGKPIQLHTITWSCTDHEHKHQSKGLINFKDNKDFDLIEMFTSEVLHNLDKKTLYFTVIFNVTIDTLRKTIRLSDFSTTSVEWDFANIIPVDDGLGRIVNIHKGRRIQFNHYIDPRNFTSSVPL